MLFESNLIKSEKSITERQEELKEGFGVVLCTKQKEGENTSFKEQIILAEEMDLPSVQFDFRNRTVEEILAAKEALVQYRESHPEISISIHGETPRIDESNLDFKNKERILGELELLQGLSGESYTVHPPAINSEMFIELPIETKDKIVKNYANIFALIIKTAIENGKKFSIAIENMPTKGVEGSWGQNIEDIFILIKEIEQAVVNEGIDPEIVKEYVGATLDINHALHNADPKDYEKILESWFVGLGDYLKVIHLYTPSQSGKEFEEKYKTSILLASQFNLNAKLFMESKQTKEVTKNLYNSVKNLD